MQRSLKVVVLLLGLAWGDAAHAAEVPGLAVTDAAALRALDAGDFGLGALLDPQRGAALATDALFALPAMRPIRAALDDEAARYVVRHRAHSPGDSIGVGPGHDIRLFDMAALTASDARFALAGLVNRMDRAYVAPDSCGEIRLIYRLVRGALRLPMTLNLVLRARAPGATAPTCADLAQRWLALDQRPDTGNDLVQRLRAPGGALAVLGPASIDRIETNLQIAHAPASDTRAFRTDYLQKVFRYDAETRLFRESPMENQVDRDRLLSDAALGRDFKAWLLAPETVAALDRGTLMVPEPYLATSSLAATPAGFARSDLQPGFGLMRSDNAKGLIDDDDVVTALQRAADEGISLQNIRSPAGFARRLNDITCGGCHQIRGIGGFHFPGVDAQATSQTGVVPASPHFVGDQVRRRAIVTSIGNGQVPDFSRGFADRPQTRGSAVLAGSAVLDGWGATCYRPVAQPRYADPSFKAWTCAEGLACQPVDRDPASPIGMCFVKSTGMAP